MFPAHSHVASILDLFEVGNNETILGLNSQTQKLPLNYIAFYTLMQELNLVSFAGNRETKRLCLFGLFSIAELVGMTKIHPELFPVVFFNKLESLVSHFQLCMQGLVCFKKKVYNGRFI